MTQLVQVSVFRVLSLESKRKKGPQVDVRLELKGPVHFISRRVPHPSRVDHAFGSARGARGIHDEQRMAERKLLELQLGQLIQVVAAGSQEVVDEHAEKVEDGSEHRFHRQWHWLSASALGRFALS